VVAFSTRSSPIPINRLGGDAAVASDRWGAVQTPHAGGSRRA